MLKQQSVMWMMVAALGMGSGSVATAFDGWGSAAFPWFGYGNNGPAAYSLGNIPAPPYFALHPPVYYSHPVPRSYGRSPFACSCDEHGQGRQATRLVVNPHVRPLPPTAPAAPPKAAEEIEKPVKIAVTPQRIRNPFYTPAIAVRP